MNYYAVRSGIDNYKNVENRLNGCIADAKSWDDVLINDFNFEDNGLLLLDSDVTVSNLEKTLTEIARKTEKDDIFVFQYSGHGTRIGDLDGDETDGVDEALYLYDGPFLDDQMREIIDMVHPEACFVAICDSCHSGTMLRNVSIKSVVPKQLIMRPITRRMFLSKRIRGNVKYIDSPYEILMAGCKDTEYSYDAIINGKKNGAFTGSIIPIIKKYHDQTYEELFARLSLVLPSMEYPQHPQLEGDYRGRRIFR